MPDPTLSAALKEAYASAPADVVVLHTLEFLHPSFSLPLRVVRNYTSVTATLEASAPVGGGTAVTFSPFAFDFKLPPAGESSVPEIEITIDNVGSLTVFFDQAANSTTPVTMIYRPYLSTDLSQPHMNPPLQMSLRSVSCDMFRVTAKAGFGDLGTRRFPALLYTAKTFPGLTA